jgi:hypothetical protein
VNIGGGRNASCVDKGVKEERKRHKRTREEEGHSHGTSLRSVFETNVEEVLGDVVEGEVADLIVRM